LPNESTPKRFELDEGVSEMNAKPNPVVSDLSGSSKYVGVPLAILVGWLIGALGLISSIGGSSPLQTSVQKVLTTSRDAGENTIHFVSRSSTDTDRQARRSPRLGRASRLSPAGQCLEVSVGCDEDDQDSGDPNQKD
jgi:hypothetical protein